MVGKKAAKSKTEILVEYIIPPKSSIKKKKAYILNDIKQSQLHWAVFFVDIRSKGLLVFLSFTI